MEIDIPDVVQRIGYIFHSVYCYENFVCLNMILSFWVKVDVSKKVAGGKSWPLRNEWHFQILGSEIVPVERRGFQESSVVQKYDSKGGICRLCFSGEIGLHKEYSYVK